MTAIRLPVLLMITGLRIKMLDQQVRRSEARVV